MQMLSSSILPAAPHPSLSNLCFLSLLPTDPLPHPSSLWPLSLSTSKLLPCSSTPSSPLPCGSSPYSPSLHTHSPSSPPLCGYMFSPLSASLRVLTAETRTCLSEESESFQVISALVLHERPPVAPHSDALTLSIHSTACCLHYEDGEGRCVFDRRNTILQGSGKGQYRRTTDTNIRKASEEQKQSWWELSVLCPGCLCEGPSLPQASQILGRAPGMRAGLVKGRGIPSH